MALDFNGTTQGITIPQGSGFPLYKNNTTYSICGWIKAPTQNGKHVWSEGESSIANALICLGSGIISPYKKLRVYMRNSAGKGFLDGVESATDVFDDVWHHFCWIDNNGTAKLYIDGIADATNFNYTRSGTFNTLYTSIMVNARASGWGNYTDGIIFDLRCYNRVLSANEIAEIYHKRGADRVWQGLVGWWRLDEMPNFKALDLSGNGNHGTLYNSPVYQASPHRLRRGVLVS